VNHPSTNAGAATWTTHCRTLLVAALSWLGLAECAQTAAAQTDPDSTIDRSTIDRSTLDKVLQDLDAAFAKADLRGYLAAFEPDHAGAHALLGQRLRRAFDSGRALQRSSTILGQPQQVGPRTVVRVRHEIRLDDEEIAVEVEDTILAFRANGDAAVPTFAIQTPRSVDCPAGNVFRCPPCNYAIGGVDGWLCVPMGRARAQALEASSFYLLGSDLACDISVRVDPAPLGDDAMPPTAQAEQMAAALRQFEPDARPGLATDWLPPRHTEGIEGLTGARIEIDLPTTTAAPDGGKAVFHVVQLGALQHLLLVRGSKQAWQQHRASLQELLASFRLLEPDVDRAVASARPLRHHIGGKLDGASYGNAKYNVTMRGPADWKAQQRCGGAAFRVLWNSPDGGRLWLTAYAVPPGMSHWCEDTADRWVRQLTDAAGLKLPATISDWQADATCNAAARTLDCEAGKGPPGTQARRLLRVAFREDLLVIVDGAGQSDQEWAAIKRAFQTLQL